MVEGIMIGFSDMLSIAQTVGIVGTMVLTLFFSKKQIQSLSIDTQTTGLSKVVELRARAMTHGEIPRVKYQGLQSLLMYSICVIRLESINEYVTEHLPEQYQICLTALDEIVKHAFEIVETSDDNREKSADK